MSAIMGRLPILLRLVLLAGALLIILAGSNAFLVREISRHVELMAENARLISALEAASAAQGAFGDMKYGWSDRESGDRSGGRLLESQRRAHAVRTRLEQQLERLEALEPEGVERIRQQLAKTLELTSAALHAYGNRQENHGAALMVKIRGSAAIVDQRLLDLVAGLEARAASEALRNLSRSRQTIEFAILVVGLAIVFGVSVTLFVVHSIRRSLAQRDRFDADRRAAEEALRNSEKRFRDIADVASDWFWEMDEALRFSYVSKRVGEIAGINPGEILGKTRPELAGAELDEAAWQHHRSDLEAHRPFRDFHYCKTLGDGRVKHLSVSGNPVIDAGGQFRGYRGTGRDVTAEVEARAELLAAKEQAELADRTKTEFLANMSHELRTPLNAIIGFSELTRDQKFGPLGSERYLQYMDDISISGQHLLGVINDILDISKIEAGAQILDEREVDVGRAVQACLTLIGERARDAGLALEAEIAPGLPLYRADERKLKQVVLNLLSNAVKFSPAGGTVRVKVSTGEGGGLVLEVIDQGIGIAPEDIPKAMAPFRQVDGDLNRRYEGTGLGLPLAKALVELHDGRFSLESAPGVGTTAIVALPAARMLRPADSVA